MGKGKRQQLPAGVGGIGGRAVGGHQVAGGVCFGGGLVGSGLQFRLPGKGGKDSGRALCGVYCDAIFVGVVGDIGHVRIII